MQNRRILVVDDNAALHDDFRKILRSGKTPNNENLSQMAVELFGQDESRAKVKIDFDLDFAFQGEEALKKVALACEEHSPYALIFMDARMPPGWDGITTIAKIWEIAPRTEMVICTAYSDYSLDQVVAKLGLSEHLLFLKKPFDSVEVIQIAIAQTKKWSLEEESRRHTLDLEKLVEMRSRELDVERARSIHGAKLIALGEMAGGIAHEINTPLAVIHACGSLLRDSISDDPENEKIMKVIDKIVYTTERIAKIIKGLRSFSRNGDNDPFESVAIGQIIEETVGICREKFKIHNVDFVIENANPMIQVECRQVQLIQVLLNLLNNAYDATEGHENRWIRITVQENASGVDLAVTDCGHGMPAAIREKIYQPFFTTKGVGKGTGLGLSISKSLIESHGGKLWLDENSKNTRFVISMPKNHAVKRAQAEKAG
jgi:two-component system NtrC family sensor kinase